MFVTCSYDGLICTYVFPNKLISIIKHPKNLHFDKVSLSSLLSQQLLHMKKIIIACIVIH